jgi:hypothetical protein
MIRRNILPLVLVFAAAFTWMTFSGPASADQAQIRQKARPSTYRPTPISITGTGKVKSN